jgi:hypothetical protein
VQEALHGSLELIDLPGLSAELFPELPPVLAGSLLLLAVGCQIFLELGDLCLEAFILAFVEGDLLPELAEVAVPALPVLALGPQLQGHLLLFALAESDYALQLTVVLLVAALLLVKQPSQSRVLCPELIDFLLELAPQLLREHLQHGLMPLTLLGKGLLVLLGLQVLLLVVQVLQLEQLLGQLLTAVLGLAQTQLEPPDFIQSL